MRLTLAALCLLLGACTTVRFGQDFDPVKFQEWVKQGETSRQQVQNFLGAPTSQGEVIESDGKRYSRWLYYYGHGRIHRMADAQFKMLEVRFDEQDKVVSYNWSAPVAKKEE